MSVNVNLRYYLLGRETCHLCHDMYAQLRVLQQQYAAHVDIEWIWLDWDEWQEGVLPTQSELTGVLAHSECCAQYEWRLPVLFDSAGNLCAEGHLSASAAQALVAQWYAAI